jgi:hypothetical protein
MDIQAHETASPEAVELDVDGLIDAALASYPMAALPPGFTAHAMARLGPAPALAGPRLRPLDVALPLALAGLALLTLVMLALAAAADPALPLRAQAVARELWAALLPGIPAPGAAVWTYAAAFLGVAVLAAVSLLDRGTRIRRV